MFDYIIVGGGSAGCVLADRLSRDGRHSVCLLEAGSEGKSMTISTPGLFGVHALWHKYNWAYLTSPQKTNKGKRHFQPRGKCLGGSSAINAMVYTRGHKADYNAWAELGNEGWGYDDVLPYFKRAESNERGEDSFHGASGPLNVADSERKYPLSQIMIDAAAEAGEPVNGDFNGAQLEGVGYFQFTIKNGTRWGVKNAYLDPARIRNNLTVITNAQVQNINFENKRAVGVNYIQNGKRHTLTARKEVILSGGAFNSPQLLMLSGVGPAEELDKHGISKVHELSGVGKNLQEHADVTVCYTTRKIGGFSLGLSGTLRNTADFIKYTTRKKGALRASITEAGGFVKSSPDLDVPNIQWHFVPLLFDDQGRNLKVMLKKGFTFHGCNLQPRSRGEVTLNSRDPLAPPRIDLNMLSDDDNHDINVLRTVIRKARDYVKSPALKGYVVDEVYPGQDKQTDDELDEFIREKVQHVYHPIGTCKMGSDKMAVVDSSLRVHGLEGLRVVDASIMPKLISANTNAPTIMIAEKASDMILSGHA